jgi:hypothetical protein
MQKEIDYISLFLHLKVDELKCEFLKKYYPPPSYVIIPMEYCNKFRGYYDGMRIIFANVDKAYFGSDE